MVSGLAAVVFLIAGLAAVGSRRAALIGGALLATNYVFVMWNRAALMESTMTAFIVVAWAAYALGARRGRGWACGGGRGRVARVFHQGSGGVLRGGDRAGRGDDARRSRGAARCAAALRHRRARRRPSAARRATLAGLAVTTGAIVALFVWPHWRDYSSTT